MSDALLAPIESGDVHRLADLLAAGADPNTTMISHYYTLDVRLTPLQAAVRELQPSGEREPGGAVDAIVLLLRHGAMVDGRDGSGDTTPLLMAVVMNHIEAVRILLAAGADPNVRDDVGDAPLRICADKGYLEMARLLLVCGATKTIDEWGGDRPMTALGLAARGLHVEMVKLLLAHGADPQRKNVDDLTPLDCLEFVDSPDDPTAQDRLQEIRRLLGDPSA
jgi:ankyrin repeat protein